MTPAFRFAPLTCLLAIVAGTCTLTSAPAYAARPDFQLPFPCKETWRSNVWKNHSPARATDLNQGSGWDDDGSTVVAAADGKVTTRAWQTTTGYGNLIVITHKDGWQTYYAHLKDFNVANGVNVVAGQKIGRLGNTSRTNAGKPKQDQMSPHLHFEQRRNGAVVLPVFNGVESPIYREVNFTSKNACKGIMAYEAFVDTRSGDGHVNVRTAAKQSATKIRELKDGAPVFIYCQKIGQEITGKHGTSNLWNKISKTSNEFIPDANTKTGSDGRVAPACSKLD